MAWAESEQRQRAVDRHLLRISEGLVGRFTERLHPRDRRGEFAPSPHAAAAPAAPRFDPADGPAIAHIAGVAVPEHLSPQELSLARSTLAQAKREKHQGAPRQEPRDDRHARYLSRARGYVGSPPKASVSAQAARPVVGAGGRPSQPKKPAAFGSDEWLRRQQGVQRSFLDPHGTQSWNMG